MSLTPETSTTVDQQTDHLCVKQLICDDAQCRERISNKAKRINDEIKNDFHKIVQNNTEDDQTNFNSTWNILCLISEKISNQLIFLFHNDKIPLIIEKYIKHKSTKHAFEKNLNYEMYQNFEGFIMNEQL
ncbi:unnamed protein product [Rotaria socialis]|uniref:Uncharacterized protein n=1 Tax=Rotaria socialis TaxID=392032 RepID=A0A820VBD1_9BILA|nr:unnamed protein product [Rotaria socialis]CAF3459532.1 unnamed protein product [Rotaria socialis]CAF3578890.1 unnamed protein product [Rotaria socialis]CAF3760246.1 unnamed protein product [Rotaria socialis]CAF4200699.1 unnamed protein product [Rotaria socialis]